MKNVRGIFVISLKIESVQQSKYNLKMSKLEVKNVLFVSCAQDILDHEKRSKVSVQFLFKLQSTL